MLRNLVLRGSVREDVLGYPRLGSVRANGTPAVNSLQPLPGKRPDNPTGAIDVVDATKGACPGAGRSRRHAGSPCCAETATTTTAFTWRGELAASTVRRAERSR
jgi:hypothetical protein